jgi:hypothetical protein
MSIMSQAFQMRDRRPDGDPQILILLAPKLEAWTRNSVRSGNVLSFLIK